MPPLVRYRIPIIGHTFSYLFNSVEFFAQCRKEYGDIFSLYIWGQVRTFVGKEHIHEVLAKDDVFSFKEIIRKKIPGDAMYAEGFGDSRYNIMVIKEYISKRLEIYNERMQTSLHSSIQKYFGESRESKVFHNLHYPLNKVVAALIANIFVGEEEAKNDEVIATFAEFTSDMAIFLAIPPILDFIYPGLQDYINRIPVRLGLYNPAAKHRNILVKHIKKQVDKRLKERKVCQDSWERPNDLIQEFIEEKNFDPNNIDCAAIADKLAFIIFASIITTSRSCTNAFIDLASRPEYIQELYEEQLQIAKEADKSGILPFEALDKMKKLDSFVKESLRLTGDVVGNPHLVLKDYTFSNGLQLPKNHVVDLYFDDICHDKSLQGTNPKSFEPFRYVNKNSPASKISKDFTRFGGGKHACPGRFIATAQIKLFMHNIILKYNFRTESGKVEEKLRIGPKTFPSACGVIFEKRNAIN
ncbi:9506_t:CDS:2 [Funneliformis caledonium]|uniref:9506_t:CDS:1 n=1 Tax=Funneliformis caledonium TaxID=1117310 RepID=A0A9N9BP53_9GLOM|nr:9506_t:CDS:2 [Funneliformis caledonium]